MNDSSCSDRTYSTSRPDGRYVSTQGFVHESLKHLRPQLELDEKMEPARMPQWRLEVRERLRMLLNLPEMRQSQQATGTPQPTRLWTEARDGYRLEKWEAYPEPYSVVPFLALIPDTVTDEKPGAAVMCFPGSASTKELLAGEPEISRQQPANRHSERNRMALHYAQAGLVAVAVENPGVGELAEGPDLSKAHGAGREKLTAELIALGRSYVGLSVFQKLSVLDWLAQHRCVDSERIAVSGHSLGTEPAMCIAALDDRVSALVFNDFLCFVRNRLVVTGKPEDGAWRHISPLWHLIPGLLSWFDFPDILSSIAPRPLIITEGGTSAALDRVRAAYRIAHADRKCSIHYYPRYSDPSSRTHEGKSIPEGLTQDEWFEYATVDVQNHCFKENLAVPWLARVLA